MLSDEAINKLVEPILKNQEAINSMVIRDIAKKIREIGNLPKSDLYKLERILKMGGDSKKIVKEIAKLANSNKSKIMKLLRLIAGDAYISTKPYYEFRGLSFIPFEENLELQKRLEAIARITGNTYLNLSGSQMLGFILRDLKNPGNKIFLSIEDTYKTVIDEAVQAAQSGVISYSTAMRRTLQQLMDSGLQTASDDSVNEELKKEEDQEESKSEDIPETPPEDKPPVKMEPKTPRKKPPRNIRVIWKSGHTKRLDSTVKQNVLDGVRAVNQEVQNIVGEQFGADGKEITVHAYPAPDHAPIQGHQFVNEEWEKMQNNEPFHDIKGKSYAAIKRKIGQWNCRHFAYSIIVGVSKPVYSDEELSDIEKNNEKGYTLPNGKHLTMYECTQYMRKLEREIRHLKENQMIAMEAGDIELAREIYYKINSLVAEYVEFCKACGLPPQFENLNVPGYKDLPKKYR